MSASSIKAASEGRPAARWAGSALALIGGRSKATASKLKEQAGAATQCLMGQRDHQTAAQPFRHVLGQD